MTIHQRLTHPEYVEGCFNCRVSTVAVSGVETSTTVSRDAEKAFNHEIKSYRDAVRQGVEPDGSSQAQIDRAMRISHATGTPYKSTV